MLDTNVSIKELLDTLDISDVLGSVVPEELDLLILKLENEVLRRVYCSLSKEHTVLLQEHESLIIQRDLESKEYSNTINQVLEENSRGVKHLRNKAEFWEGENSDKKHLIQVIKSKVRILESRADKATQLGSELLSVIKELDSLSNKNRTKSRYIETVKIVEEMAHLF